MKTKRNGSGTRRGWTHALPLAALLAAAALAAGDPGEKTRTTVEELTRRLWPRERIERALEEVDRQKAAGILGEAAHARRRLMLLDRLAGTYRPGSLSVEDPPLDFIQNGGFEGINPNSAKDRSRWLWWGGWSWGGDYENMWEDRPEYVHSGKLSARIRCVGATGRIGINTPPLPMAARAMVNCSGVTDTPWPKATVTRSMMERALPRFLNSPLLSPARLRPLLLPKPNSRRY